MNTPIGNHTGADKRFDGLTRLYGRDGLERLRAARVCVIGIGGVGSWAAEALARSSIGALTLIDLDEICETNLNRQVHALEETIGRAKVDAMAERIQAINPHCRVTARQVFFTPTNAESILAEGFDHVVDGIDNVPNKCLLLARCRALGIPVVTAGAAGGRRDPGLVRTADLSRAVNDTLLARVRKILRRDHSFPRERRWKFKIDCVYSPEPAVFPGSDETVCSTREPDSDLRLDCESGLGTAAFVTGTIGFALAARVVNRIATG